MIIHPVLKRQAPALKLLYFILILAGSLFFVNILGMVLAIPFYGRSFLESLSHGYDFSKPDIVSKLKYLQIVNQFALFIIPSLVFSLFAGDKLFRYVRLKRHISGVFLMFALAVVIVGLPFINWIGEVNARMSFPQMFSGIEQWMKSSEAQAAEVTTAFLNTPSGWGFVVNMMMIAILPAIGEELFFRGVLQRIFNEWFGNIHVAVLITAFIFSAIHMQFYGFIPRFLLGIYLGYIFYWSGNLWIPIMIHFMNNGIAVCVAFLSAKGLLKANFDTFGRSDDTFVIVFSAMVVSLLVFLLFRNRRSDGEFVIK